MTTLKATAPGAVYGSGSIGNSNPIGTGGVSIAPSGLTTVYTSTGASQTYSLTPSNGDYTLEGWINLGASGASAAGPAFAVEEERIDVSFSQKEQGTQVKATLNPDTNLSTIELLRLNVLLSAGHRVTHPLSYIRAYSLERHFTFEAE